MNGKMNQITAQTSLIKEVIGSMQIASSKRSLSLFLISEESDPASNYLNALKISAYSSFKHIFYIFELNFDEQLHSWVAIPTFIMYKIMSKVYANHSVMGTKNFMLKNAKREIACMVVQFPRRIFGRR